MMIIRDKYSHTTRELNSEESLRTHNWLLEFFEHHPEYNLSHAEPFIQGAANLNRVFRVSRKSVPAVVKRYGNPECKRKEHAALAHYAPINVGPRIVDCVDDYTLVMSELPGEPFLDLLNSSDRSRTKDTGSLFRQVGHALAQMVSLNLNRKRLETIMSIMKVKDIAGFNLPEEWLPQRIQSSWSVHAEYKEYGGDRFASSIRLQEQYENMMLMGHRILCLYDLNPTNMIVTEGWKLSGFVDFESGGFGTPCIQLGELLYRLAENSIAESWLPILEGYGDTSEHSLGKEQLLAVLAAAHQKAWAFVNCWGHPGPGKPGWFSMRSATDTEDLLTRCDSIITCALKNRVRGSTPDIW